MKEKGESLLCWKQKSTTATTRVFHNSLHATFDKWFHLASLVTWWIVCVARVCWLDFLEACIKIQWCLGSRIQGWLNVFVFFKAFTWRSKSADVQLQTSVIPYQPCHPNLKVWLRRWVVATALCVCSLAARPLFTNSAKTITLQNLFVGAVLPNAQEGKDVKQGYYKNLQKQALASQWLCSVIFSCWLDVNLFGRPHLASLPWENPKSCTRSPIELRWLETVWNLSVDF